jgi:dephospho-CoA kinase
MVVIGIIGSAAGGKSTVAKRLREHGAAWINADRVAHRCLDRPEVSGRLVAHFGDEIAGNAGRIDRKALAARVFGDDAAARAALDYLQRVIHPVARHLILRRLGRAAVAGVPATVLDAPLLLEADWGVLCDFLWCIDTSEDRRAGWIEQRGWSIAELRRRESRQLPIAEKRRLATQVIENNTTLSDLLNTTDRLWDDIWRAPASAIPANPTHCLTFDPEKLTKTFPPICE